ncbi:BatD family protein [Stenotrophomonas maltophilia group sp. msm1]|uniref:BatD family protein n=1 Tax=Stenotrophomonas maltophilia group sp. msm1 TaxID=3061099 RepID=UPI0013109E7D|nr:BatD family protein [Stenotrophomonas maltophilia group sp. msm1]MDT3558556.1 BatD family protein [Stenotrophomonas maltophilia group sp. msm1]
MTRAINMHRHWPRQVLAALLLWLPLLAWAQPRAWLDRDRIALGDTVMLNVESDQGAPDFTPLRTDFDLSGQTSSRQVEWRNGSMQQRTLYGVALTPRRSGALVVPGLQVGSVRTAPLTLQVDAAAVAGPDSNAVAFIETVVDDETPYVQQSVGVVVRLYFASQLASGELVLDTPAGASLQRVGDDRTDVRQVNGRRYNVVERRFLLVPERSGALRLAGARFSGRSAGGFFDDFFGGGDGRMNATGADRTLQVQAQPAQAPQPWLPLQGLQLRYTSAPARAHAGEAANVVVEAIAEGATRAQFTDLPVPDVGNAAQVFAEPAQYEESFNGSTPRLKITRRYSIVPRQPGSLVVPGPRLPWWDVRAGKPQEAKLPDLTLAVAAGNGGGSASPAPLPPIDTDAALPGGDGQDSRIAATDPRASGLAERPWPWMGAAIGLALLWLLTLLWGWQRGRRPRVAAPVASKGAVPAVAAGRAGVAELRRALDGEGFDQVEAHLCAMAGVDRIEQVIARLDDPAQRQVLQDLQQARWGGQGDLAPLRTRLREVFRDGPHWSSVVDTANTGLPPLYPPRRT